MEREADFRERMVQQLGTIMMVTWMLILGPIGAVLLVGVAHSMLTKNPIQGMFCGVLLALPLLFTTTWGIGAWLLVGCRKRIRRPAFRLTTEPTASPPVNSSYFVE